MTNLKIVFWYSNRIKKKLLELLSFTQKLKIDIILFNEKRFPPTAKYHLTNCLIYKNDLPLVNGKLTHSGLAIPVRRRIIHLPEPLNTNIQSSSICVKLNGLKAFFSAVYKPPKAILITNDLDLLIKSADWQISAGDFKSKHPLWNSHFTNSLGKVLFNHVQCSNYYVFAPITPPHFPTCQHHRTDILDIALVYIPLST